MKPSICKVCKSQYTKSRMGQVVCCAECAMTLARSKNAKAEKVEITRARRAAVAKLKTRSDWMKEAQAEVNKYVRLRDAGLGCISCDKPANWGGQWHASHFRSVGAASSVRFNLWNIHKSCSVCNNWKSGNLSEYEPRLREKIGNEKVDWLRAQNQLATYSIEYLKRLKNIFKKRAKRLEMELSC